MVRFYGEFSTTLSILRITNRRESLPKRNARRSVSAVASRYKVLI